MLFVKIIMMEKQSVSWKNIGFLFESNPFYLLI